LEQRSGVLSKETWGYVDGVIEFGMAEDFEAGPEGAAFRIVGGVDKPGNARQDNGSGAHGAGLESDVKSGAAKAVVVEKASTLADHDDFSVGGGIVVANGAIAGASEDRSIMNEEGPDRNLARLGGSARLGKSELHEMQVVWHGRR